MLGRGPRSRIERVGGVATPPPKPIPLTCPLCHEPLGAVMLEDPTLRFIQVEVECDVVDGGVGHRELHIKTLDLAKKEDEAAAAITRQAQEAN